MAAPEPEATRAQPDLRLSGIAAHHFTTPAHLPALRSNAQMAQDILDLTFQLESGRALPVLSRFEGPIGIRLLGTSPGFLADDLAQLVGRLRNEAGLPVSFVSADSAQITVQTVSRQDITSVVSNAACFVVPNVADWQEFRAKRRSPEVEWANVVIRTRAAIFLPVDVSPQEMRDCLHEELAQSMGPLNDLFRLPDSVFNDDNITPVLTGFDMLALRALYAPELHSGMTKAEVAARLPAILARLNPAGEGRNSAPVSAGLDGDWKDAIMQALTNGRATQTRILGAERAIAIAQSRGMTDTRLGFGYYILGRLEAQTRPAHAIDALETARLFLSGRPEAQIYLANVNGELAALMLAGGNPARALALVEEAVPAAIRGQDAALTSRLMLLRATALAQSGRAAEAEAARLDSLAWARYGFGSDRSAAMQLASMAALRP